MNAHRHWSRFWGVYLFLFVFLGGILGDRLAGILRSPFGRPTPACSRPIAFHLGEIDPRFGLSDAQAKDALAQAAALWNRAARKTLFADVPSSGLSVNFVYSQQQDTTKVHQAIASSLAENRQNASQIGDQLARTRADFSSKKQVFEAAKTTLNLAISGYNQRVQKLNGLGGGSPFDRQQSEMQKSNLLLQQQELDRQVSQLRGLENRIGLLTVDYNTQVMHEQTNVDAINVDAGKGFISGEYINLNGTGEIKIFQYNSFNALVAVLAHELGHALGLGHIGNSQSVMSATSEIRENDTPATVLSNDDLGALRERCRL
jgi:hypothetical protein